MNLYPNDVVNANLIGGTLSNIMEFVSDSYGVNCRYGPIHHLSLVIFNHKLSRLCGLGITNLLLHQLNRFIHGTRLQSGEDRIAEERQETENLQNPFRYFPPAKFFLPAILGVFAVSWGWWRIRDEHRFLVPLCAFLLGACLWTYGFGGTMLWIMNL
jgi:hypothetical protein